MKAAPSRDTAWAMSEENVDLVRDLYALGDWLNPTPDETDLAFRDYLDEQFELRLPPDYPEGKPVFRGREGVAQWRAMLREAWDEWRVEPERFLDAGERVVVFARLMGTGGASGVPFELETTHVLTIHAGRIASMHVYRDRSEALEAAGVRE
jgi:ketosteroid isomerase-like protein